MKTSYMRKGIAMIELIFAIVIMGIVLMSAPMLISTATKSSYIAMQQESIASAASEIGMILTQHWDEGNANLSETSPILVTAGDGDLNQTTATGRRAGTPLSSERGFFLSSGGTLTASTSTNFTTEGDFDDIDDFNGNDTTLKVYNSEDTQTNIGDYIDTNISIRTTVAYIDDTPTSGSYVGSSSTISLNDPFNRGTGAGATSNIKLVSVRLTTTNNASELEKNIILHAFTCNIGTYELAERSF